LAEKLEQFDPAKHGGEAMETHPIGGRGVLMVRASWLPDRRDVIWIDCNPQLSREMKDFPSYAGAIPEGVQRTNGYRNRLAHDDRGIQRTNLSQSSFKVRRMGRATF